MHNQVIEMRKQSSELRKQVKYAKYALLVSGLAVLISLLSLLIPIAYDYLMNDRIVVPSVSRIIGLACADELNNISIEDSDKDVMRSTFTIFEANGKVDCFTNNKHVFFITNNNNIAIAISDIYFRVNEYYPISNFFQLYYVEGWGDVKHNIYKFDIGTGTRKQYHGVKCDSSRQPMNDTFTRIDAHSIESFSIEYNFAAQGVYYGDLVFGFEINNQHIEKVISSNSNKALSTSKIVYLPEADDFEQNAGPEFLEFYDNEKGAAFASDGFTYINDTFSCLNHIKQHLMAYYPNFNAYYQCVLDYYVPFFKQTYTWWDIEANKYRE